ncbi:MAG: YqeG family HAD IIIA-type phosphatase [Lachnospiraceae bacterium]|nr:YqeG family HAD IIIA-type phosphatase [Lachnospiraceae bacterium]
MSLFRRFYPTMRCKSAYDIPYEEFYAQGYRGIIYDIDNTLVCHGAPADEHSKELFDRLHAMGFSTCLISNNNRARVLPFARAVHSRAVWKANKPSRKSYAKAMRRIGTTKENTIFVGDQLLTDIYGANRIGLKSVLTEPISPKEEIQIVFKRKIEKIILYFYEKRRRK